MIISVSFTLQLMIISDNDCSGTAYNYPMVAHYCRFMAPDGYWLFMAETFTGNACQTDGCMFLLVWQVGTL